MFSKGKSEWNPIEVKVCSGCPQAIVFSLPLWCLIILLNLIILFTATICDVMQKRTKNRHRLMQYKGVSVPVKNDSSSLSHTDEALKTFIFGEQVIASESLNYLGNIIDSKLSGSFM